MRSFLLFSVIEMARVSKVQGRLGRSSTGEKGSVERIAIAIPPPLLSSLSLRRMVKPGIEMYELILSLVSNSRIMS